MRLKAIRIALTVWVCLQMTFFAAIGCFSCVSVYGAQLTTAKESPQKKVRQERSSAKKKVVNQKAVNRSTSKKQSEKNAKKSKNLKKPVSKSEYSQTSLNNRNTSIEELKSSIKKANQDKQELQSELKKSEKQIIAVRNNLKKLQKQREKVRLQLKKQQEESIRLEAELAHEQKVLEEINRQRIQELASRNAPSWSADSFRSERTEIMLTLLAQKSKESIARLDKKQKELAIVLAQANKNQKILLNTVDKEKQEQERLKKERLERQRTVAKLDKELVVKETTLKKLQADEKRLGALVAKLQRQEKIKPKEHVVTEKKVIAETTRTIGFNPVDGRIIARFGEKRKGSTDLGTWKGTVFSVTEEKPVKAVRPGKVVFSDYLKGYGNLLIIEHANGYYSVYGNNSRLEKDIGDKVKQGDEISKVGSKESDISILYFEVRHKGKPIDPASWLNI